MFKPTNQLYLTKCRHKYLITIYILLEFAEYVYAKFNICVVLYETILMYSHTARDLCGYQFNCYCIELNKTERYEDNSK